MISDRENTQREKLALILGIVFSLVLLFLDAYTPILTRVRFAFSVMVSPIPLLVSYPRQFSEWMYSELKSKQRLHQENQQLQQRVLFLQAALQKFYFLQHENAELRASLASSPAKQSRLVAADVLSADVGRNRQLLLLNKGSRAGVFVGQPVLDARGVMGQVIDVGFLTSTVLLITDNKCAVPVQNDRTGERAIVVGTNTSDELSLLHLPKTSAIRPGDLLLTSGLGQLYPAGYPVGRVSEVSTPKGDAFIKVKVRPIAALSQARLVLLVSADPAQAETLSEVKQRYLFADSRL
jgi:rod shape-determining protein MreC